MITISAGRATWRWECWSRHCSLRARWWRSKYSSVSDPPRGGRTSGHQIGACRSRPAAELTATGAVEGGASHPAQPAPVGSDRAEQSRVDRVADVELGAGGLHDGRDARVVNVADVREQV